MFELVTIRVADVEASTGFYDTVLRVLGFEMTRRTEHVTEWSDFSITRATDEHPVTRGLHIGFAAPSRAEVDEFWHVGVEAGYRDDGSPGPRPQYRDDYYGSFLLDPDGNSAEAVHHGRLRSGGAVDHLWIRVADVAASKRFYEGVAVEVGFRVVADLPERATFSGGNGSFSVVAGTPAENVHLTFPAERAGGELTDPDGNRVELSSRRAADVEAGD